MRIRKSEIRIFILIFWFYMYRGFIFSELIDNESLNSILFAISDVIIFSLVLFRFDKIKDRFYQKSLIVFSVLFLSTYILTSPNAGLIQQLNGIRGVLYFLIFSIYFQFIFNSNNRKYFIKIFNKNLFVLFIVQTPISIYQYMHTTILDEVGGTFGSRGSGIVTLLLFTLFYYFLINIRNKKITLNIKYLWLLIFFIPMFLNETKIAFVLFPVMAFLFLDLRKSFLKSFVIGIVLLLFLQVFIDAFAVFTKQNTDEVLTENYFLNYLLTQDNNPETSRLAKNYFVFQQVTSNNITSLFGNGYGLYKGSFIGGTTFVRKYYYLIGRSGNTGTSILLLQGGLLLIIFYIFILSHNIINNITTPNRTFKHFIYFFYFLLFVPFVYNNAYINVSYSLIMGYMYNFIVYNNQLWVEDIVC